MVALCGLNCPAACGILVPGPGIKPEDPALEDGFLTTGPPGKSLEAFFKNFPCPGRGWFPLLLCQHQDRHSSLFSNSLIASRRSLCSSQIQKWFCVCRRILFVSQLRLKPAALEILNLPLIFFPELDRSLLAPFRCDSRTYFRSKWPTP